MPGWVFWGILMPWLFADLATIWFCFVYMVDDPLGPEEEEEDDWSGRSASSQAELPDA
jgi:hypothetical protein